MAPAKPETACQHKTVIHDSSPWAEAAGFVRRDEDRRLAAATTSGRNPLATGDTKDIEKRTKQMSKNLAAAFPAPLVLPFDELNWDPNYAGQSTRSWANEPHRNKPTKARDVLYVASVPEITDQVDFMREWTTPRVTTPRGEVVQPPDIQDYIAYLSAFYHGIHVKALPQTPKWTLWTGHKGNYVGLTSNNITTRIRYRTPPSNQDTTFPIQLNLSDILDHALSILPSDAYAICLLADHDLYEDENDDFCCGRAYGGSRVCVVSTARYHPLLDESTGIDRSHMWPLSHCAKYVEGLCKAQDPVMKVGRNTIVSKGTPLEQAVRAAARMESGEREDLRGLWFSRVARTVAHELGHCLGMDHCIYYACSMQATNGMVEDVRQPPYLCPVCLAKLTHAVVGEFHGKRGMDGRDEYVRDRYAMLERVCEKWHGVGMFVGFGAWLRGRIASLDG